MMFRRTIGPFGVKDLFTLVNLLAGVVALKLALQGDPRAAGYAVLVGFLLGDLLDGTVARLTGTSNRFGAEFDAVTDHFVHVFVPGVIFYVVYRRAGHSGLALVAVAALVGCATIRHARFAAARFDFPLAWCGLPRTVSGFAALSFPLSNVGASNSLRYPIGFVLVTAFSALNLVPVPYMTHRGERAMQTYVKVIVAAFIACTPVAFVVARRFTFDALFLAMAVFALGGWVPVRPDERRAFYAEYHRWASTLSG